MPNLIQMAEDYPDLQVSIRLRDLQTAAIGLAFRIMGETERAMREKWEMYGDCLVPKEDARLMLGKVDKSTLWRWEKAGYLSPVRIGTKVFYKKSQLESLMQIKTKKIS